VAMGAGPLRSPRLVVRPATVEQLLAELESRAAFEDAVGCPVPADWPPEHWDEGPIRWLLEKAQAHPDEPLWTSWFIYLRQPGGELIIGTLGCKGPPANEGDGRAVLEIGYGVVASQQRKGIASEAVGLLLEWLRTLGRVTHVRAHTLSGDPASGGVLRRCGFTLIGKATEDGMAVDRWERAL